MTAARPGADQRVPVLTVLPADPEQMAIGGIASFVRGFVKFAPPEFDLAVLGVSDTRPLGRWSEIELEGRAVRLLPVTRGGGARRSRLPIALRFAVAVQARRAAIGRGLAGTGWIHAFHRPSSDIGLPVAPGRAWRVVHLSVADLTTRGSESRWRRLAPVLDRLEGASFRRMGRIFVVNRAVADAYRARFPDVAERIEFVPNWADPTIFRPRKRDVRARVRGELGVSPDAPLVLFAGRLEGQKDPLLLADAFAQLRRRVPEAMLVVAGDGALREPMRALLEGRHRAADAIRFPGIVARGRIAELMAAADLLAITSAFETGPTVGLEALASGLPVVTTPVGEVARIVSATGAGRTTAVPRSPEALAHAMGEVIEAGPALRAVAVEAAAPYLADRVLAPLYDHNRRIAAGVAAS